MLADKHSVKHTYSHFQPAHNPSLAMSVAQFALIPLSGTRGSLCACTCTVSRELLLSLFPTLSLSSLLILPTWVIVPVVDAFQCATPRFPSPRPRLFLRTRPPCRLEKPSTKIHARQILPVKPRALFFLCPLSTLSLLPGALVPLASSSSAPTFLLPYSNSHGNGRG